MRVLAMESMALPSSVRAELRALWSRAFGDRFSDDDAAHAYGGVHVVAYEGDCIVGHAGAVPRRVCCGSDLWREIGYVEAVAVDPAFQRRGVGREVMRTLHGEIEQRWDTAMLSTGRATAFYEGLGWERWLGISYTLTPSGAIADGEHASLMIRRNQSYVVPDLHVAVTCEERQGDAW